MGANGDEEKEEKQTTRGKRKGETIRKDCLLIAMVGSWKGGGRGAKRGEAIRIVVTCKWNSEGERGRSCTGRYADTEYERCKEVFYASLILYYNM
jgi:hypothetical protein